MREPIATAMVLAAGLGTRMRPLTDTVPKPLVKVGGKTLLDRALDPLVAAGIRRAVVNVHYRPEQIEAHCALRRQPEIIISDERAGLLDSGGGVKKALPHLGAHFFVLNADSFWTDGGGSTLESLSAGFDPARMDMLMLLATREKAIGFDWAGDFFRDESGRLRRRGGAPQAPYAYAGVLLAAKAPFCGGEEEVFSLNRLWDESIAKGRLYGQVLDGFWYHVGTPVALAAAESRLMRPDPEAVSPQ